MEEGNPPPAEPPRTGNAKAEEGIAARHRPPRHRSCIRNDEGNPAHREALARQRRAALHKARTPVFLPHQRPEGYVEQRIRQELTTILSQSITGLSRSIAGRSLRISGLSRRIAGK